MGCYGITCAVTNCKINHGDQIVAFAMKERSHRRSVSDIIEDPMYINSYPLFGEYDDYGGIENIDFNSQNKEKVISFFNNEYGEIVDLNEVDHFNDNEIPLMIIHRKVYEELIPSLPSTSTVWANYIQKAREDADKIIDSSNESLESMKDTVEYASARYIIERARNEAWRERYYIPRDHTGGKWSELLINDTEESEYFLRFIHPVIMKADVYNYRIMPSKYSGQDSFDEEINRMADIVKDICKENIRKWNF